MANLTKEQYERLRRCLFWVDKPMEENLPAERGAYPCYGFDSSAFNVGKNFFDADYIDNFVFEGVRNPWNAVQKMVAIHPEIKELW